MTRSTRSSPRGLHLGLSGRGWVMLPDAISLRHTTPLGRTQFLDFGGRDGAHRATLSDADGEETCLPTGPAP